MRAAVIHEHGGPENLVYETAFPDPECGAEDVILRVRAASLNYHDIFTRRGMPGITLNLPVICGLDFAGEIVEVGASVSGWSVGDRVLVDPSDMSTGLLMGETVHGGLAEYCRVPVPMLIRMPENVDFNAAASLPCAYGTAHRMMVTNGKVREGERCLILGASGGVGTCCVKLAKMVGAEVVVGSSSRQKRDRLREFGADHGIDYGDGDFFKEIWQRFGKPNRRTTAGGVDIVVNFTGGDTWVPSLKCLRKGGRLLTCGATAGYDPETDIRYIWTFELKLLGSNSWRREDIEMLLGYVAAGKLTPAIDRVLPLNEAREALRLLEDREVFGKVIVVP